jgi:hypothetical protein
MGQATNDLILQVGTGPGKGRLGFGSARQSSLYSGQELLWFKWLCKIIVCA